MIFEDEDNIISSILNLFPGLKTSEQKQKIKQYVEHVYNEGYIDRIRNTMSADEKL